MYESLTNKLSTYPGIQIPLQTQMPLLPVYLPNNERPIISENQSDQYRKDT